MKRTTHPLPPAAPSPVVTLREAASEWAGRAVLADEISGRVDANALADNQYGMTSLISVQPWRPGK